MLGVSRATLYRFLDFAGIEEYKARLCMSHRRWLLHLPPFNWHIRTLSRKRSSLMFNE